MQIILVNTSHFCIKVLVPIVQIVVHCVALQRIMKTHRWPRGGGVGGGRWWQVFVLATLIGSWRVTRSQRVQKLSALLFLYSLKTDMNGISSCEGWISNKTFSQSFDAISKKSNFSQITRVLGKSLPFSTFFLVFRYWKNYFRTNFMSSLYLI